MSRIIMIKNPGHKSSDGTRYWWNDSGSLHREDGPAVVYYDGSKEWFLDGEKLTQIEHFHKSNYFKRMNVNDRLVYVLSIP